MRLIVLRPEPGASATVERARSRGLPAEAHSLFAIEPLDWTAPDPAAFDGLLLTSANAVRSAGPQLATFAQLPIFAVGAATAAAARGAGLRVERVGDGGVEALLYQLPPGWRLLHLAGQDRIDVGSSQSITIVTVYRSAPVEPAPRFEALAPAVLLVHSARAGRRLAELVGDRSKFDIVAISSAAAAACGGGWRSVTASNEPEDAALLSLAAELCQASRPK